MIQIIMEKRHSVRGYKPCEIPQGFIENVIKLALTAPCAGGIKGFTYKVVTDNDEIERYTALVKQDWMKTASVLFIVKDQPEDLVTKYWDRGKIYAIQNATIFLTYIDLLCVENGYGTCWVGGFDPETVDALTILAVGGI